MKSRTPLFIDITVQTVTFATDLKNLTLSKLTQRREDYVKFSILRFLRKLDMKGRSKARYKK